MFWLLDKLTAKSTEQKETHQQHQQKIEKQQQQEQQAHRAHAAMFDPLHKKEPDSTSKEVFSVFLNIFRGNI